jgi:hypothetical protein
MNDSSSLLVAIRNPSVGRDALRRVIRNGLSARPLHALERAGDEIAAAFPEEERFADVRLTGVGKKGAVQKEAQAPEQLAPQREVTGQPFTRPTVAHGDADAVSEMVLRVARHVDAVATTFLALVRGMSAR